MRQRWRSTWSLPPPARRACARCGRRWLHAAARSFRSSASASTRLPMPMNGRSASTPPQPAAMPACWLPPEAGAPASAGREEGALADGHKHDSSVRFNLVRPASPGEPGVRNKGFVTMNDHAPRFADRSSLGRERSAPPPPAALGEALPRVLSSQSLFLGLHEIGIEHQGALYRLKIARQGKLILNK